MAEPELLRLLRDGGRPGGQVQGHEQEHDDRHDPRQAGDAHHRLLPQQGRVRK